MTMTRSTKEIISEVQRNTVGSINRLRLAGGFLLLAIGLVCVIPGVPGPGVAIIVVALLILRDRFVWASKALAWVRRKARAAGLPDWTVPGYSSAPVEQKGKRESGDLRALKQ